MPHLVVVSGPSGSGKTTWLSQFLQEQSHPVYYASLGLGDASVDLARIGYRFPWVQVVPESQLNEALADLPDTATVYLEIGFQLDLESLVWLESACDRIAVLPPDWPSSDWHDWADQVVTGNAIAASDEAHLPEIWHTSLTGQVFDPPSLDELFIELTGGAYGHVHRVKGVFELPDGRAFYVDFVEGLPGIEYTELSLPRWLEGRPQRPSGIEVVGWDLQQQLIALTLLDSCLADSAIAQHQQYYKEANAINATEGATLG